jgi:hypothetical protein
VPVKHASYIVRSSTKECWNHIVVVTVMASAGAAPCCLIVWVVSWIVLC